MPRDVVNCCSLCFFFVLTLRQLETFELTDDEIRKRVGFWFTTFELLNRKEQGGNFENVQTQNFNSKIRRAKKKKLGCKLDEG